MAIEFELSRTRPEGVALAVAAFQGEPLPGDGYLERRGFEAEVGHVRDLPGEDGTPLFVLGLGARDALDARALRKAAGNLARAARRHETLAVDVLGDLPDALTPAAAAQAVVEGVALGGYAFTAFKSSPEPAALERVVLVGTGRRVEAAIDRGRVVAGGTAVARDLVNEPGGSLTPAAFADRVVALGHDAGFDVTVWDEKAIRRERLGGLLGVNRGSQQPPRFLRLAYEPSSPRATVALVGKGITFDSGGLSLKPSDGMAGMKGDMGGAAAVVGALSAIARVGARVRVLGYVPLTDNMPGPDATRVGDVLTIRNDKTVEVLNTDAEGRLVLADALSLATEDGPDAIVDLATLTGACMVALGERIAGLMGNHQGWLDQVASAAHAAGEPVWPLPLPGDLRPKLDSDVADLKNIAGGRWAGTLVAGLFLQEFVGAGVPWAHLDIAGPAFASEVDGDVVKGGTGFGVRTLVQLATSFTKPKASERTLRRAG